jgi:hypothetical protein
MRAADVERWLLDRDPTASGAYGTISKEEYARSFTAARTAGTDIADDLYFAFVDVVSRSGTEDDFSKLVMPILRKKGWLGGDEGQIARRVELIYDTNLRLARAAGRWDRYWSTRAAFPYLLAFTAGDERVRHPPESKHSDHRAWDGILLPIEHPFWREYWTPLGFRCRCGIRQLTRSQFARLKRGETSESDLAARKARLGPPVFLAPSRPIAAQLDAMVDATNASRMPGMPAVDPAETAAAGRAALSREQHDEVTARITAELDRVGLGAPAPPPAPAPQRADVEKLGGEARSYVLDKGRKAGVEYLVAFDEATGREYQRSKGSRSAVSFSPALLSAMRNPARSIILHHNHPGSTSLSGVDVLQLNEVGARSIWAHGHNGSSFYAERAGDTPIAKATFNSIAERIRVELQGAVTAGTMTVDDAVLMHNHLTWRVMSDLGLLIYRAELAGASGEAFARHADLFRAIIARLTS